MIKGVLAATAAFNVIKSIPSKIDTSKSTLSNSIDTTPTQANETRLPNGITVFGDQATAARLSVVTTKYAPL